MLAFTLVISFFSVVIFSLTPIVSMSREEMRAGLTEGSRTASGTVWHKFGANLVVVELATAVILLAGAGLLGKSFYRLLQVDPGLQPNNVATLLLSTPRAKLFQGSASHCSRAADSSSRLGIARRNLHGHHEQAAGRDGDFTTSFRVVGRACHGEHNEVAYRIVSTDYFKTLQARLLEGRYFTSAEDAIKPHVALINRALARASAHLEHAL